MGTKQENSSLPQADTTTAAERQRAAQLKEAERERLRGVKVGGLGIEIRNMDDLTKAAQWMDSGGWLPDSFRKEGVNTVAAAAIAIQFGMELGIGMVQAVQQIYVVNGKPTMWGDLPLALCMRSPRFDHQVFREWVTGTPSKDDWTAHTIVGRVGVDTPIERTFSLADANKAKLANDDRRKPWKQYPEQMLRRRARAFALRDAFPDILKGMYAAEELTTPDAFMDRIDIPATEAGMAAASASPEDRLEQITRELTATDDVPDSAAEPGSGSCISEAQKSVAKAPDGAGELDTESAAKTPAPGSGDALFEDGRPAGAFGN